MVGGGGCSFCFESFGGPPHHTVSSEPQTAVKFFLLLFFSSSDEQFYAFSSSLPFSELWYKTARRNPFRSSEIRDQELCETRGGVPNGKKKKSKKKKKRKKKSNHSHPNPTQYIVYISEKSHWAKVLHGEL